MDGWNTTFLLRRPIFRCYVSFREGRISSIWYPNKKPKVTDLLGIATGSPGRNSLWPTTRWAVKNHLEMGWNFTLLRGAPFHSVYKWCYPHISSVITVITPLIRPFIEVITPFITIVFGPTLKLKRVFLYCSRKGASNINISQHTTRELDGTVDDRTLPPKTNEIWVSTQK